MGALHVLTALQVKNAGPGAKLSDGGGLRLDVDPRGGRSWVFRYKSPLTGKERYMGLGAAPNGSADAARKSLADARQVLSPIWMTKETAARVRGRIEQILDATKAHSIRTGDNPATLSIIKHLLPKQKRKAGVKHHPALPFEEIPKFWKSLAADTSDAARMLRSATAHASDLRGQASIIDGDTLAIHGTRIRLWGIDAPESSQLCRGVGGELRCAVGISRLHQPRRSAERLFG